MNERSIQLAILADIRSSIVCACPNYTPLNWWECDLWAVNKSGRWREYEIKVSVADFKNDCKKSEKHWDKPEERKHDLLAARSVRGPSQFYYAVPESIADQIMPILPEWAGLIVAHPYEGYRLDCWVSISKRAPTLAVTKTSTREIRLAQRRMWYRYWESLRQIQGLTSRSAPSTENAIAGDAA